MATVVDRLELEKDPIKKGLVESRFFTKNTTQYLSFRELIFYYLGKTRVRSRSRNVIEVSSTSQDPKTAANIANEVGNIVLENSLNAKNEKIKKGLAYIDGQINALIAIIKEKRS